MICPCPVGLFPAVRMLTALLLFAAVSAHAQATDRHPRPPRAEAVENRHNHGHDYPHRARGADAPAGVSSLFPSGQTLVLLRWRLVCAGSPWVRRRTSPHRDVRSCTPAPSQHRVVGRSSLSLRRRYRLPLGSRDRCLFGRATPARRGSIGRRGARGPRRIGGRPFFRLPERWPTSEQQSADRYECHAWSKNQTGFDPTEPSGGVGPDQNKSKSAQYDRAMSACLEARRYSVR